MNSRTKKILILSLSLFLGGVLSLTFLLYQINTKGAQLDRYITALSEQTAQEAAFIKVKRLVAETEQDRNTLASAFFADESDSISFLGDLERFAKSIQIELKTEDLNKKEAADKTTEYITMRFVYSGSKDKVSDFTKYLETIPYHAKVESLTLESLSNGIWKGSLTLNITIKPS